LSGTLDSRNAILDRAYGGSSVIAEIFTGIREGPVPSDEIFVPSIGRKQKVPTSNPFNPSSPDTENFYQPGRGFVGYSTAAFSCPPETWTAVPFPRIGSITDFREEIRIQNVFGTYVLLGYNERVPGPAGSWTTLPDSDHHVFTATVSSGASKNNFWQYVAELHFRLRLAHYENSRLVYDIAKTSVFKARVTVNGVPQIEETRTVFQLANSHEGIGGPDYVTWQKASGVGLGLIYGQLSAGDLVQWEVWHDVPGLNELKPYTDASNNVFLKGPCVAYFNPLFFQPKSIDSTGTFKTLPQQIRDAGSDFSPAPFYLADPSDSRLPKDFPEGEFIKSWPYRDAHGASMFAAPKYSQLRSVSVPSGTWTAVEFPELQQIYSNIRGVDYFFEGFNHGHKETILREPPEFLGPDRTHRYDSFVPASEYEGGQGGIPRFQHWFAPTGLQERLIGPAAPKWDSGYIDPDYWVANTTPASRDGGKTFWTTMSQEYLCTGYLFLPDARWISQNNFNGGVDFRLYPNSQWKGRIRDLTAGATVVGSEDEKDVNPDGTLVPTGAWGIQFHCDSQSGAYPGFVSLDANHQLRMEIWQNTGRTITVYYYGHFVLQEFSL
jgi:hypothetical protein